ncbi:hypothetical protein AMECASPLE_038283, partial [Ameca splendens]
CFRCCWSSQVCWVTGVTYSIDYLEEYLSRRLPALQRQSVLPSVAENLNFGFTSLITDFVSGSFWTNKITYVLRTLSPNCFHLDSDQAGSFLLPPFPGPRLKCTLSTLQRKYLHIELSPEITKLKQHQRNHLNNFCFDNLDSESLYPWRPDRTHLLKILQFSFPDLLL